ncbi:MAG: phosphate acyltransferase PlsX [Pseudomonadota bacterium]|uniref:Phosphate acyltransferase n=1 Tax=Alteromonas alba TaxID=2079529 RepID=A0A2S9V6N2_9ALTE|nr:phosphate acyltransferase PlsX [Alteromonas alba]MCP4862706.1 phosphate acyltransferase PlsX [Alteromonas sp.]MDY6926870.1 phosphate acyltransferase PlsX [Pseudomonadota bacterium]PRO72119.1 phosphate acyltransferase PlsX [Alteromonas alba]
MSKLTIALDIMGGDHGPPVILSAVQKAIQSITDAQFILCGDENVILPALESLTEQQRQRAIVHHCEQIVEMGEPPTSALRNKKQSSMWKALQLVESGEADACVSAGNTGALLTMAFYLLKTLPGIDRPALVSDMPTASHHRVFLLDLGANVNCTSEILFQYGVMASVLAEQISGIESPRVALLNVGEEDIKGNAQVKYADQLFKNAKGINYIGYVEGDDIFTDYADVVVTDGFTGNIALKSCEGLAKLVINEVKRQSQANFFSRMMARIALPLLKTVYNRVNPDQYNGASLLGLRGIVIKSHGNASAEAFYYAILQAKQEAEMKVPEKIKSKIETVLLEQL